MAHCVCLGPLGLPSPTIDSVQMLVLLPTALSNHSSELPAPGVLPVRFNEAWLPNATPANASQVMGPTLDILVGDWTSSYIDTDGDWVWPERGGAVPGWTWGAGRWGWGSTDDATAGVLPSGAAAVISGVFLTLALLAGLADARRESQPLRPPHEAAMSADWSAHPEREKASFLLMGIMLPAVGELSYGLALPLIRRET